MLDARRQGRSVTDARYLSPARPRAGRSACRDRARGSNWFSLVAAACRPHQGRRRNMHQSEGAAGTPQGDEAVVPAQPLPGGIATALPSATTTVESPTGETPPDDTPA